MNRTPISGPETGTVTPGRLWPARPIAQLVKEAVVWLAGMTFALIVWRAAIY